MEKYSNKFGYYISLITAFIYSLIIAEHLTFFSFLRGFIGFLLFNIILSGTITVFWKFKYFGKVLGVISIIIFLIGRSDNKNDVFKQKQKTEIQREKFKFLDK